jgi:hypothetical protein
MVCIHQGYVAAAKGLWTSLTLTKIQTMIVMSAQGSALPQ